jgi:hypothetical protein
MLNYGVLCCILGVPILYLFLIFVVRRLRLVINSILFEQSSLVNHALSHP